MSRALARSVTNSSLGNAAVAWLWDGCRTVFDALLDATPVDMTRANGD
jgi:hypothetical protein